MILYINLRKNVPGVRKTGTPGTLKILRADLLLLPAGATAFAVATATTALSASTAALACGLCVSGCESCGGKILLAVLLTVADPDLDAEASDLGVCNCKSVVDIGAECMERSTSFLEHFAAGHFGAAYAI